MPFLLISLISISLAITLLILLSLAYNRFKSTRKRTAPSDLTPSPHKFPFSSLRRATASFSGDNRVGQGGFGSVYRGVLDSGQVIAVKLMSEASTQGEFEFQNELSLASSIDAVCCPYLVSVIGFSTDDEFRLRRRRRVRRLALVYEFMENGSLQDALLDRKCVELMNWKKRFEVIMCVAKGIEYLHNECVPAVVHGDIKPSNVLLDSNFDAKIADFGLAQVVREEEAMIVEENGVEKSGENDGKLELGESDEVVVNVDESPESFCVRIVDEEVGSVLSEDSVYRKGNAGKSESKRDWWWKQESVGGVSESGRVKDYVMEWIGSEINKEERSKKDWGLVKSASSVVDGGGQEKRKKLEWWGSLDRETFRKEKKSREPKEWWKEEFCEELCRKKKKKKKARGSEGEMWWQKDEDVMPEKKRRRSRGSRSSIDGDFRMGRRHSQDWTNGDIPKSGGISSTPSMRGTVCYIAPECGGGAQVADKCDVYSFGVLLLVLVSGRRPLQVMASPMSEFERANLISWARQLAVNGKLLDLVDSNIQCLDQEQALLCITIGLLCLQRSPNKRPAMKDIVEMLSGKSEPPNLPFEFSPSPPSNYPFKSRRKAR